jgi:hypothetical protein
MATTWNPADIGANLALSNANLTVTTTSLSSTSVRATASTSAIKRYCEFTSSQFAFDNAGLGFGNASASLSVFVGSDANGVGFFTGDGWYIGGTKILSDTAGYTAGNVFGLAIDPVGLLVWIRAAAAANWNNNGLADPATGVGGAAISFSGPFFPMFNGQSTGDNATANFGATPFVGIVPAGYSGFDSAFVPYSPWPQAAPILAQ